MGIIEVRYTAKKRPPWLGRMEASSGAVEIVSRMFTRGHVYCLDESLIRMATGVFGSPKAPLLLPPSTRGTIQSRAVDDRSVCNVCESGASRSSFTKLECEEIVNSERKCRRLPWVVVRCVAEGVGRVLGERTGRLLESGPGSRGCGQA